MTQNWHQGKANEKMKNNLPSQNWKGM